MTDLYIMLKIQVLSTLVCGLKLQGLEGIQNGSSLAFWILNLV